MSGVQGKVALAGGASRLACAVAAKIGSPPLRIVRSKSGQPQAKDTLVLDDYDQIKPAHLKGCSALIYCIGIRSGSFAELQRVNHDLALHYARIAHAARVQHVIYVSSFSVFGAAEFINLGTPPAPNSDYGRSRLAAEQALCKLQSELADPSFSCTMLRLPMLYGAGTSKLEKLVSAMCRIGMLPIDGGDIRRSMLSYDGAAQAVLRIIKERCGGVLAIADEQPFSYNLLARSAKAAGSRVVMPRMPALIGAAARTVVPNLWTSLYDNSYLEATANSGGSLGLVSRLEADLTQMFRSARYIHD
jgi:nucleoside-diphosphate-sugar epimerase